MTGELQYLKQGGFEIFPEPSESTLQIWRDLFQAKQEGKAPLSKDEEELLQTLTKKFKIQFGIVGFTITEDPPQQEES